MSDELWIKRPCEHGFDIGPHIVHDHVDGSCVLECPGGSEERLDPATLSQIIHDLQDEYGHDTRHDIGLAILDALRKT